MNREPADELAHESADDLDDRPAGSTVTIYPDGPLVLRGDFEVRHADGSTVPTGRIVALCRCGRSAVKPFCDNSHQYGVRRAEPDEQAATTG